VIREVLLSWILTLPIAAVSAALFYLLLNQIL
jgi:phosphate/sulfate permease